MVPDRSDEGKAVAGASFNPLQGSRWFQTSGGCINHWLISPFQSASGFAVVPDPTPWHAVLTSPVVVVLHTTPPHPLQQADRTCPQWGKTPSQVPYTPEAVLAVLQHPCLGVSPRCPVAGSWASSSESTSGRVPSRGAGSDPGRGRVCCSAAGSSFDTAVR